jgi:hypothetical protein
MMASNLAGSLTGSLQNTNLEPYRYTKLLVQGCELPVFARALRREHEIKTLWGCNILSIGMCRLWNL